MKAKEFVTCLNCIDGRVQVPVLGWIKKNYGVDYIDMITEAGMDGFLADEDNEIEGILEKIRISISKHYSETIFIVGHHDCAGNPVDDTSHKKQIFLAVRKVKSLVPAVKVVGLWVSKRWLVREIAEK